MRYLAIPEATASWLSGKAPLIDRLHELLFNDGSRLTALTQQEFVEGPLRISASPDGEVLAVWNLEYNSSSGDDPWGFIDISDDSGIAVRENISREVLDRGIYLISQRLQGLLIEGSYIHISHENGAHSCLAGRGTLARQFRLGYLERDIVVGGALRIHTILIQGPDRDLHGLVRSTVLAANNVTRLVQICRQLYAPGRRKASLSSSSLVELRRSLQAYFNLGDDVHDYRDVTVRTDEESLVIQNMADSLIRSYSNWLASDSPLTSIQRRLLQSDALYRHPIRITGPAGSGKTLLMQLLAIRCIVDALKKSETCRVLYMVHNSRMAESVRSRLELLLADEKDKLDILKSIEVQTIASYAMRYLDLEEKQILDPDAQESKEYQLSVIDDIISETIDTFLEKKENSSKLLREIQRNIEIRRSMVTLLMAEISIAIKGHGLGMDERRYIYAERPLSRLHGVLGEAERRFVFGVFKEYHIRIFETSRVLDTDDVALSLLGKLRTPIWELRRSEMGYDHVFVDETQLFNENERRLFSLLGKKNSEYVPVVVALDEAQDLFAQNTSGLAALGIENIANENLQSIHRSSKEIVKLAFFVIQRSTDLFGPDFPDFTGTAPLDSELNESAKPIIRQLQQGDVRKNADSIIAEVRRIRKSNRRGIAVICMAESFWKDLTNAFAGSGLPVHVLERRGERLNLGSPLVVLSRPAHIGGQEFDAVVIVGAEQGLLPPRIVDNDALAAAVDQQALRELYLSITRAKYELVFVISGGASPCYIISEAEKAGLLNKAG